MSHRRTQAMMMAGGGSIYAPLLAAIDASAPTLEYNPVREFLAGNYADGVGVATYREWRSGTYNALQADPAKQPTFVESANGGHPALRFDGNDYLQVTGFTYSQPNTILVVAKFDLPIAAAFPVFDGVSDRELLYASSGLWRLFAGDVADLGANDTSQHVFVSTFNGASSTLSIDGVTSSAVNSGTNAISGITIGASGPLTSFFYGDIQIGPFLWDGLANPAKIADILTELALLNYITL